MTEALACPVLSHDAVPPRSRGSARVAVQVLKHASTRKDQRVIVVTSNDRFNHTFYDVEEADHLLLSHNEVGSALKAIGGIRFAIGESLVSPRLSSLERKLILALSL